MGVPIAEQHDAKRLLPSWWQSGNYEGILPICQNEAGLAVVMSHEVAHALARHGGERMSQETG